MPTELPTEWNVVTFLDDAASEVAHIRDAQPICFTLPASIEQAAANEKRAAGWARCCWCHWLPDPIELATHGSGSTL